MSRKKLDTDAVFLNLLLLLSNFAILLLSKPEVQHVMVAVLARPVIVSDTDFILIDGVRQALDWLLLLFFHAALLRAAEVEIE